jgi:hypothetical protein
LLVALAQGQRLCGLNETAGAVGEFLEIHVISLGLSLPPCGVGGASSAGCGPDRHLSQMTVDDQPAPVVTIDTVAMWEPAIRGGRAFGRFSRGNARVRPRSPRRAWLPASVETCGQAAVDWLERIPVGSDRDAL